MKSCTNLGQSQKLKEILPIESADWHYVRMTHDFKGNPVDRKWSHPHYGNPDSKNALCMVQGFMKFETAPCWSLIALLSVLPNPTLTQYSEDKWNVAVFDKDNNFKDECFADEPIDACYEMIVRLRLNKEDKK